VKKKTTARVVFLISTFLYWVSLYLYMPTLPTYVLTRTATLAVVGTVLSMYGLWQALLRIPVGISVDRAGNSKYFIVVGLLVAAAGAAVMGVGKSVGVLILGRALTGVAAATWVPLIGAFSGLFSPAQAVFATSLLTFSGSVGRMSATSLTGFLNGVGGYPLAFFLAGAAGVLGAAIVFLTKTPKAESKGVTFSSIFTLFRRGDVMLPSVISLIAQLGTWAVTFSFMPILAEQLGANDVQKSLLLSLNLLAFTIGNLLNTVFVKRIRPIALLVGAFTIFTSGIVLMVFLRSLAPLYAATAIMGFANGFSYPTLMGLSIQDVEQSRRTSAMGIHQSVYAFGMFGGPWIGGALADRFGIQPMFGIVGGFVYVVGLLLIVVYMRVHRNLEANRPVPERT
jgi:MFS family permease